MMIYVNELMDVCKIVAFLHPTLMIFKIIFSETTLVYGSLSFLQWKLLYFD